MPVANIPAFADHLATLSGAVILPFFRAAVSAEDKSRGGVFDPVTEADRGAERVIRQAIKAAFPDHGIICEEYGAENADAEHVWILDPIDGTKSFISGLPLWGTLIALQRRGRPIYGMMHQPFTGERFFGDGSTAHWRGRGADGASAGKQLRTRPCAALAEATVMTTSPLLLTELQRQKYCSVEKQARLHRYGGDCYAYCMVASGHVDLVIEAGLKPYDIAALIPIVEGAGGVVTTWDGGDAAGGGAIIAAGDRRAHAAALQLLAS